MTTELDAKGEVRVTRRGRRWRRYAVVEYRWNDEPWQEAGRTTWEKTITVFFPVKILFDGHFKLARHG